MTPAQRKKQQTAKKRADLKAKRAAKKLREQQRKEKRKAKQAARMAPKKALAAWSVGVRACGVCAVCGGTGKSGVLHAHHLLPKERYPEYKFEPINGVCLCPLHHKFGKFSAHRNPIWFVVWLKRNRPEQWEWCRERMGRWQEEMTKYAS